MQATMEMDLNAQKQRLKEILSEEPDRAIDWLRDLLSNPGAKYDELILIRSRYSALEKKLSNHQIPHNEYDLTISNLSKDLLNLIENVKEDDLRADFRFFPYQKLYEETREELKQLRAEFTRQSALDNDKSSGSPVIANGFWSFLPQVSKSKLFRFTFFNTIVFILAIGLLGGGELFRSGTYLIFGVLVFNIFLFWSLENRFDKKLTPAQRRPIIWKNSFLFAVYAILYRGVHWGYRPDPFITAGVALMGGLILGLIANSLVVYFFNYLIDKDDAEEVKKEVGSR